MNQIILLDYEPRTTVRVTEALTQLECEVVAAKDVDAAVAACAKVEPRMVLITSVLPHIKVEDAITQLRARAGLRNTPFLVMMSGYTGQDPQADALGLGAQDIVAKPFSNEDLLAHVKALLSRPRQDATITADTRAEMIEALRRGSGKDTGMVTSEELFGDLLADEPTPSPAETQRIAVPPLAAASAKSAAKAAASASAADEAVARALDGTLSDLGLSTPKTARPRKERTDISVDKLLEDTLSGLEVGARHGTATHPTATTPGTSAAEGAQPGPATAEPESGASAPGAPAPAVPVAPLPGGTPFGQYELIEPIATGGMAEVYRARMRGVEGFQKIVAIKRILPHLTDNDEFVTMFVDEAKLAAQLQHPNIIHIYDLGKIERSYYIAMEYIDGKDLRSILRALDEKKSRLPLGLALFIASRLAAALDYAHRKKDLQGKAMALVHRDISPQNVLISFDGDIKLCDFGIAKATSKASHTRAGALKGKLQYMSPEQAWGRDIDHRSDIFSLGLVLYEMLTGRKGFAGDSELSILEQVRAPKLVPPREIDPAIPPEVERVVLKALKEDCEQRYQTAAEFASELGNILQVIRPAPGASELGSFLADLVGRERPVSSATAPAARPAIAPPPAAPAKPAPAPRIPVMEPVAEEAPEGPPPARRRLAPIAAVAVGVVVVVAAVMLFSRAKRPATSPSAQATPAPETVEMAREAARQEVAKQTQAMQGRLAGEIPTPAAVAPTAPAVQRAAVPAAARPAVAPTQQPRQAPAAKASVPTPVPAQPSPVPTEAAAPAPAAVQPIEKPPTAVPATPAAAPTHAPLVAVQPAVKQGDLVEMGNGVVPPEPIYSPKPAYPPLAERQRIGGTVLLAVLVDENGSVQDIQVLRPITPDLGLTAAAVAAARTWRYKPATKNGVRVKVRITQAITFRF